MENKYREKNLKHLKTLEDPKDIHKYFDEQAQFFAAKQKFEKITNFNGDFDFLNNEYECEVYFEGLVYPNVYNAYQAARTPVEFYRSKFSQSLSIYDIYELSNQIDDPPNWEVKKLDVMEKLLRDKFMRHKELEARLLATSPRPLMNSYNDKTPSNSYWGCVGGQGENHLGKLLMKVRADHETGHHLEKWTSSQLKLSSNAKLQPDYIIEVYKDGTRIEIHELSRKFYYVFGSSPRCDVHMPNPTVAPAHCLIAFDSKEGLVLVDLNSENGTFKESDERVPRLVPTKIDNGATFRCGNSARIYKVTLKFEKMQEALQSLGQKIDFDVKILRLKKEIESSEVPTPKEILNEKTSDTLFVTGFESRVSEEDLREVFAPFGEIHEVRIPRQRDSGLSKGFAFVQFENSKAMNAALKSNGVYIGDTRLILKVAEMKKAKVYHAIRDNLEQKQFARPSEAQKQALYRGTKVTAKRSRDEGSDSSSVAYKAHKRKQEKPAKERKSRRGRDSSLSRDFYSSNSKYSSRSVSPPPKSRLDKNKRRFSSSSKSPSSSRSQQRRR